MQPCSAVIVPCSLDGRGPGIIKLDALVFAWFGDLRSMLHKIAVVKGSGSGGSAKAAAQSWRGL